MLGLLLVLILGIPALIFKKSKVITIALFGLMWVLFGWNYWNGDYDLYESMYNNPFGNIDIFKYEGGYNALMLTFNLMGFSFQQFFIAVSGISLLLLLRFVLIFSELPALIAFCFLLVFFPIDYVLLRNFIAFVIMLQGLIPVLKDSKRKYFKFIFFVLLASTIHISSFFYLIFLFAFGKKEIRWPFVLAGVFGMLIFFILADKLLGSLASGANGRDQFYLTKWPQFIIYSFYQVMNLYIVKYFLTINTDCPEDKKNMTINRIVLNINILLLFLIVLYYNYAIFIRILLNVAIVNVILISNKAWFAKENKGFNNLVLFFYLLFFFIVFVFVVMDDSLLPLYNFNLLIK